MAHCSLFVLMSQAPFDEAYTLGLLVDLRDLCQKIGDSHFRMAAELHDLLRKVAHPGVSDVDKDLTFRVTTALRGALRQGAIDRRPAGPIPDLASPASFGRQLAEPEAVVLGELAQMPKARWPASPDPNPDRHPAIDDLMAFVFA
jgi:hypothetical protein